MARKTTGFPPPLAPAAPPKAGTPAPEAVVDAASAGPVRKAAAGRAAKAAAPGAAGKAPGTAGKASTGKASAGNASGTSPAKAGGTAPAKASSKAAAPVVPPRRRAVANAEAAAHGRTVDLWTPEEVTEAFTRFERIEPEPRGELEYINPFTLLVAVVLSAQATDAGVNKATRGLFAAAATPQAMVALGEEGVASYIRTIGLYRGKAKNVVALSRLLIARHGGEVPRDREALEALPGVGRKTANVVLNIAFGQPTIAVDTHLFRVANRTGLAPGKTPLEVETELEARIPERFKLHAHHWLILHGRYICKARQPECRRCPISDLCRWPDKTF